jgi:pimeloyl-ACP methyl ester carboxylesterase
MSENDVSGGMMSRVHEARLEIDGAALYYKQRGEGTPVLFIHGGGTSSELWGDCFDRIGEFARGVAFDLRSFGKSGGPPGVAIARHADDAVEIIDRLGLGPVVVLGHSFGATIGMDIAARYPDRVSALVLLEPPIDFRSAPNPSMVRMTAAMRLRHYFQGDRAAAHWFFKKITRYRSKDVSAFDLLSADIQEICLANAPPHVASFKFRFGSQASGRHLPKGGIRTISCPTTCILGTDSFPPFVRTTRNVAEDIPGTRVVEVEGASHVLPYDAGDEIVDAVREAVAGVSDVTSVRDAARSYAQGAAAR